MYNFLLASVALRIAVSSVVTPDGLELKFGEWRKFCVI
jgi:hypothetical protein